MQAGPKVDLSAGVAAAHNVLHNAEDTSHYYAHLGVRNEGAISQDHHQSTFGQRIDLSRMFGSNNAGFGFTKLQTNTKNQEHHQESDEESSNADGYYFSD